MTFSLATLPASTEFHLPQRRTRRHVAWLVFVLSALNAVLRMSRARFMDRTSRRSLQGTPTSKIRVLYIVTSLSEYDVGTRATIKGNDRFNNTLMPVLRESTQSMLEAGFDVDLYLITQYDPSKEHRQQLRELPVDVTIWENASPLAYAYRRGERVGDTIDLHTRGLARQHRYVIKDHLLEYDLFVSFEDDMVIKGEQVQEFDFVTQRLYQMRQLAPESIDGRRGGKYAENHFYGPMTKYQYMRVIPGFLRVEAALVKRVFDDSEAKITPDYAWEGSTVSLDPLCCQMNPESTNEHLPRNPSIDDLSYWETEVEALGLRQFPDESGLGWALLQVGNSYGGFRESKYIVGDYWTGSDGLIDGDRPSGVSGRYLNNQGGWMGTPRQIFEWSNLWCQNRTMLPPFDLPKMKYDGLESQSVEYWSGGIQIVGSKSCNLQRVIPLEPTMFSKHLLYHSSNNKQKQYPEKQRSIQKLWGQLNTARKKAEVRVQTGNMTGMFGDDDDGDENESGSGDSEEQQ